MLVLPRPQAARRAAPRRADASAVVLFGLPRAAQAPLGLVSPPFPQPSSLAPSLLPPYIWLSAVLQCVLQCVQFKRRSRSRDYRPTAARRTELRRQSTHGRARRIEGTDRPTVSTRGQGVLPPSPQQPRQHPHPAPVDSVYRSGAPIQHHGGVSHGDRSRPLARRLSALTLAKFSSSTLLSRM